MQKLMHRPQPPPPQKIKSHFPFFFQFCNFAILIPFIFKEKYWWHNNSTRRNCNCQYCMSAFFVVKSFCSLINKDKNKMHFYDQILIV
jgi:hypothetical protein